MKILLVSLIALGLSIGSIRAQIGVMHTSLESKVAAADLIVRAKVVKVVTGLEAEQWAWLHVTLKVKESLKGKAQKRITFTEETLKGDKRWEQFVESGQEQLWFLMDSGRPVPGENPDGAEILRKHPFKPIAYWSHFRLSPEVEGKTSFRSPPPLFTMEFEVLAKPEQLLAATRRIAASEPKERPGEYSLMIPRLLAQRTGHSGDANSLVVPDDRRLETLAWRLIATPEDVLPKAEDWPAKTPEERKRNQSWLEFSANRLRAEGAKALRKFKSEENVERLEALLDHPAKVGSHGIEEQDYFVRRAAFGVLEEWGMDVEKPVLVEGRDARPPKDDDELRYWLENMLWHHRFGPHEVAAAIGLEGEVALDEVKERFKIYWNTKPKRAADAPLLVLPYPGGRHPRIGFLDGAIQPQRETKVSVFAPWDDESYVVADVPEAIWSNLGLTYLAHTHVPTVWTKQGAKLERLEWNRREDGTFDMQRKLPNGIEFGTKIVPTKEAVRMEMWLKNGTEEKLTGLRVQNCVMLKGAHGFASQSHDNKILKKPYVAVRNEEGTRWIITAWDPCDRTWANEKCPCLHSDPKFPDCAPGETQRLRGWLSFYEGKNLDAELERIEKIGWRE